MFVWLRRQGFESSYNNVLQKEKLVNSKTIRFTFLYKEVSSAGVNLVQLVLIFYYFLTIVCQIGRFHTVNTTILLKTLLITSVN